MVTTEQIPIVNIQKIKRKESKHITKGRHQTTKEEKKRVKIQIELQNNQKTINKIAISINNYFKFKLNYLIKRHRVAEWIEKNNIHLYADYKRFILAIMAQTDRK